MKKNFKIKRILLLIIAFLFIFSSCTRETNLNSPNEDGGLLSVKEPQVNNVINGKWKLMIAHEIEDSKNNDNKKSSNEKTLNNDEIFITPSVFTYKGVKIIDPNVSARYINLQNYLKSKSLVVPETLILKDENVVVYKFQDNKIISQDVILLGSGRILIFQKNQVEVFEKYTTISQKEEEEQYSKLKQAIEGTDNNPTTMEYAISLGVRKNNYNKTGQTFDYDYKTYFIIKKKDYTNPRVLSVNDIVYSKDSVLWTVEHDRSLSEDKNPMIIDKISVNPTFRDEEIKVNYIQEKIARRIDYVNDNYIAFTNKNPLLKEQYDYYEIHNTNQLAKNKPLKANNIGGQEAVDSYNNAFSDTLFTMTNQTDSILNYQSDDSNIGIERNRMAWSFISNFQATTNKGAGTLYRKISLQIIPILDLAAYDNKNIAWRDVLNRVPFATNAIVSPDGKTIVIQSKSQIYVYSIYNNFISLNPQLTITNVSGEEIIMSKWYPADSIDMIYEDYLKLPRLNTQLAN